MYRVRSAQGQNVMCTRIEVDLSDIVAMGQIANIFSNAIVLY